MQSRLDGGLGALSVVFADAKFLVASTSSYLKLSDLNQNATVEVIMKKLPAQGHRDRLTRHGSNRVVVAFFGVKLSGLVAWGDFSSVS